MVGEAVVHTRHEVAYGVSDQDLAAVGESHHAGRLDHSRAVEVVVLFDRFPSIDANPDADRRRRLREVVCEGLLHRDGRIQCPEADVNDVNDAMKPSPIVLDLRAAVGC